MQGRALSAFFPIPVLLCAGLFVATAPAGAAPAFAISATKVTMPMSGGGSTQYTVNGIPMTGTLSVVCLNPTVAAGTRTPTCEYGPLVGPVQVTAGQTVTGDFSFFPYGSAIPLSQHRRSGAPASGLALAGVLLFGFGFRRKAMRWLAVAVAAVFLACLSSVCGCAGNPMAMTPGAYRYTLTATNGNPLNNVVASVSTTIAVTVP